VIYEVGTEYLQADAAILELEKAYNYSLEIKVGNCPGLAEEGLSSFGAFNPSLSRVSCYSMSNASVCSALHGAVLPDIGQTRNAGD